MRDCEVKPMQCSLFSSFISHFLLDVTRDKRVFVGGFLYFYVRCSPHSQATETTTVRLFLDTKYQSPHDSLSAPAEENI